MASSFLGLLLLHLPPAAPAGGAGLTFTEVWSVDLPDGSPVAFSSPDVATLDGVPAVVVGDQMGHVYAFSLASGRLVPGWPASSGGAPVESTPSVAALTPGSPDDTVFVGAGTAAAPHEGGYEAFNPNGSLRWSVTVHNPGATFSSGVVASLAVGDLQGGTDVAAPSIGEQQDAINARNGAVLTGFPWFQGASDFATPALADLYGSGKTVIIDGGAQAAGTAYGVHYSQGGQVRVLVATGNSGANNPNAGLLCEYDTRQAVQSSPAVGTFLIGSAEGIVTGTGDTWPGAPGTDAVLAFTSRCHLAWTASLDGLTLSSPALADVTGNGRLSVVEGTDNRQGGGSVYALNGATGAVIWHHPAGGEVIGGVVCADLGSGNQDVVVAATNGAEVLDGRDGQVLATLESGVSLQNSALVTGDPNGTIGITVAGHNRYGEGVVEHFELEGSPGADADQPGSWPMFHHDPQLTGNAGTPITTFRARHFVALAQWVTPPVTPRPAWL